MFVWGVMLIPIIAALVLYVWFKHKTTWWEFLVPLIVSVVLIAVSKLTISTVLTNDTEYWGGLAVKAEYYERWNEYVHRTCTRTYTVGSGKEARTKTETYDCSYVRYHPPRWVVCDSNGKEHDISQPSFEELTRRWKNREFVELHRRYHTIDGDKYIARWDNKDETLEPVVTVHTYMNKVQASDSVFNFQDVDPKEWGLYEYLQVKDIYCPSILGAAHGKTEALRYLDVWNAKLGKVKQVRMWVLIFREKPLEAGLAQENYWKGGNKNEVVVCIGLGKENTKVTWCHVFSWTEVEELKIEIRDYISRMGPFDLMAACEFMVAKVKERFVRKQFADFDYLTVSPPWWAVLLVYLITAAVNAVVSWWIVVNEAR